MEQTQLEILIKNILEKSGLEEGSYYDAERKHLSITCENSFLNEKNLPLFVSDVNHVIQLLAKKHGQPPIFVDVNNYQKKREGLIAELAKAAARKAISTKTEVALPPMNSYERRLVHVELAAHPDVKTESVGDDKKRCVVVRAVEAK